ncbi:MAG: type II toxin-antitoxin system RelE/ParE family toxin [Desulfotalea sp.]
MTYDLEFNSKALKEWRKLEPSVREQFKKKLGERLENPHIQSARLKNTTHYLYKIKLRNIGYRLVYLVVKEKITVQVITVGKRDKSKVHKDMLGRLPN